MDNKTILQLERLLIDPCTLLSKLVELQKDQNKLLREFLDMRREALAIDAHRVSVMHDLRSEIATREAT